MRMIPTGLEQDKFDGTVTFIPATKDDRKKGGAFARMLEGIRDDERAVLLGVYLLVVHNECEFPIDVQLCQLFDPCSALQEEERKHPDFTGHITIVCDKHVSTVVTGNDRILYRPQKLNEAMIEKYAGLEHAILNPRSIQLPHDKGKEEEQEDNDNDILEVFAEKDPLIEFIVHTKDALNPQRGDIVKMEAEGATYYQIKDQYLQSVRQFFKDTIGDYILYTRFEDTHIKVDLPRAVQEALWNKYHMKAKHAAKATELPNVVFTLEFSYLLISPGELSMRHKKTALK